MYSKVISLVLALTTVVGVSISASANQSNEFNYYPEPTEPLIKPKIDEKKEYEKMIDDILNDRKEIKHVAGELIIGFQPNLSQSEQDKILQGYAVQKLAQDVYLIENIDPKSDQAETKASPKLKQTIKDLSKLAGVKYVELNGLGDPALVPTDPLTNLNWHIHNNGNSIYWGLFGGQPKNYNMVSDNDIDGQEAWDITLGSANTVVAVLDSGVRLNHEDLQGAVWVNTDEAAGNGVDDDNNGFVDDVNGWNFLNNNNTVDLGINSGGHGNKMAGIIGARINNGKGAAGVCPQCKVMPIVITGLVSSFYEVSSLVQGLQYATNNGAKVANLSFTLSSYSQSVQDQINNSVNSGVTVVASAGNSNTQNLVYPGAMNNVISVTGLRSDNVKSVYSNYNSTVDLSTYSTTPDDQHGYIHTVSYYDNLNYPKYEWAEGTSASAAIVSGVAGLMYSLNPSLTPAQVTAILKSTVDDVYAANPTLTGKLGTGRVNAFNALKAVRTKKLNMKDINRDGYDDLIWRNGPSSATTYWFMNGLNTLSTLNATYSLDANWDLRASGDFNGDGKTDLVWYNASLGKTEIWVAPNAPVVLANGVFDWFPVTSSDFNNDGKADLVWRNNSTSKTAIWYMNGATQLSSVVLSPDVASPWEVKGSGDFNNDGKSDLLWRNPSTKVTGVWLMNNSTVLSTPNVDTVVAAPWDVKGTGDYNNDGNTDILWRNSSTGDTGVWYMNGTTKISTPLFASSPVASPWDLRNS